MIRQQIIYEVIKIILKFAKPERIYLYGSSVTGDATETSDIDIAFDDPKFKDDHLIRGEVDSLKTLIKVDIKNLAHTEARFKNRVASTGKVLYSASKELRAQDGLYNFSNAYKKFAEAVNRKDEFYNEGFSDIYLDLVVKRFEFTFEMSWKAIKRYLSLVGIDCPSPRECFKEAFVQRLIGEESVWLEMLEQRNLSSHVYDGSEIAEILPKLNRFELAFKGLKKELEKKVK